MTLYRYQVIDASGEVQDGQLEAANEELAVTRLRDQGLMLLQLQEASGSGFSLALNFGLRSQRISNKALVLLTGQLSSLLGAGLPLDRALTVLISISEDPKVANLLTRVQEQVRGGSNLADALEAQHGVFSRLYLNMVRAGELGGSLEVVMQRLAEFLERARALRDTVISALIYPSILFSVAVLSVLILLTWVVPQFQELFADSGKALPLATQIVIAAGDGLRHYWWVGAGVVFLLVVWMRNQLAQPDSRLRWDGWFLRWPLVGGLVSRVEMARFSRTLGTLLGNGVALLSALAIVRETMTNQVLANAVGQLADNLKSGQNLSGPLQDSGVFPPLAVHMIRVGEETGQLEAMLLKVADTYDREVQSTVQRMLALLEPLMILGLGVVIAAIIMSILVAIMSLNELAG